MWLVIEIDLADVDKITGVKAYLKKTCSTKFEAINYRIGLESMNVNKAILFVIVNARSL